MNAQQTTPTIKKESKNRIKVEFERTPLKERLKAKFINAAFVGGIIWYIIRFALLLGIAYIILFPFYTKIAGSFMGPNDFVDVTVMLIPKDFSIDMYKYILLENNYFTAFGNTLLLSVTTALVQTLICALIAYGLAKFKFKASKLVFAAVVFTMVIPHSALQMSLFMNFRYFDVFGIVKLLSGHVVEGIQIFDPNSANLFIKNAAADGALNLMNTNWPLMILSFTGLAFKNGLFIFLLRQFFRGVPDELEESAYIDGSGVFRTFVRIILPLSIPMLITVFLFSFSWQWTDDFYTGLFFTTNKTVLMSNIYSTLPKTLTQQYAGYAGWNLYSSAIRNTSGLLIMIPLIIMFLFCQKFLVQGIERSGITG